jgi:large subunit ribosomal protein L24
MKLRTDDEVIVISGKDKGKTGKILRVDRKHAKVYVEGINIVKRHMRPNPARPNAQVGVIEREGPVHVSNVALVDPKDHKPTRVGTRRTEEGARMRVTKRSGTEID